MDFLRCPHTHQPLAVAGAELLTHLIARRETLRNYGGEMPALFESGWVSGSPDAGWFYPVRDSIPVLLPGEAIALPPPAA